MGCRFTWLRRRSDRHCSPTASNPTADSSGDRWFARWWVVRCRCAICILSLGLGLASADRCQQAARGVRVLRRSLSIGRDGRCRNNRRRRVYFRARRKVVTMDPGNGYWSRAARARTPTTGRVDVHACHRQQTIVGTASTAAVAIWRHGSLIVLLRIVFSLFWDGGNGCAVVVKGVQIRKFILDGAAE